MAGVSEDVTVNVFESSIRSLAGLSFNSMISDMGDGGTSKVAVKESQQGY